MDNNKIITKFNAFVIIFSREYDTEIPEETILKKTAFAWIHHHLPSILVEI